MLALVFELLSDLITGEKTPLDVGGIRTQVLADSMAIAASALNHCTTKVLLKRVLLEARDFLNMTIFIPASETKAISHQPLSHQTCSQPPGLRCQGPHLPQKGYQ